MLEQSTATLGDSTHSSRRDVPRHGFLTSTPLFHTVHRRIDLTAGIVDSSARAENKLALHFSKLFLILS